jgi:U2-associated protein SR140
MHSLDDTDPFACGRRITLRWGKHIIRDESHESVPDVPKSIQQRRGHQINERPTIQVRWPGDSCRERWISTVADFVARDGSAFENVLMSREADNSRFDFLFPHGRDHAYYKWRVFSFCHGDHRGARKAPFSMLEGGCMWVPPLQPPPPSTNNAIGVESAAREVVGGGGRRRTDGRAQLNATELGQAHQLFRFELCASRQSICRAMAFCFEKTAAAHHVASILRGLFTTEDAVSEATESSQPLKVSVETLVSRLYLLSDVLFNSQQPSIKHAFLYRSAIESMAPGVFSALGSYSRDQQARGRRWTAHHKLATSVHVVLQAWTAWNVYPPAFLQELQARFEGRQTTIDADEDRAVEERQKKVPDPYDGKPELLGDEAKEPCILEVAQGQWTTVDETHESHPASQVSEPVNRLTSTDREDAVDEQDQDGEPLDDDDDEHRGGLDGEPVDSDDAGSRSLPDRTGKPPLAKENPALKPPDVGDPDGEALEVDDPDGEPLPDEDPDGAPLVEDDPDGEPIDDADGEPIDIGERQIHGQ